MRLSRWFLIFTYFFLAYASGFIPVRIDENLRLRNMPSVEGSRAEHVSSSQVRQLGIGTEQVDLTAQNQGSGEGEWGVSKQVGEHTWTLRVGQDTVMATASDIFSALNVYRQRNGKGTLTWDDSLAHFAQSRASYFVSRGDLDGHAGFSDYVNNQDGFHKLGFYNLGENSSYGYQLAGVHLIEWVYAGDKPHNDNQLNSDWTHVGIGVAGTATDLVFGGKKL